MMKNPLIKRLPRELKSDAGKYLVIFLFLTMLICLVSGFLVADYSTQNTYNEGITKYNLEDGHLTFNIEPDEEVLDELEDSSELTFYDLKYVEETPEGTEVNIRIFADRDKVDLACLMSGQMPEKDNEIALDRMFAENNDIEVGDKLTICGKELTVSGLVALPDFSCLFENNADMMFDSLNFGVAVMSREGFDNLGSTHLSYNYAWKYDNSPADEVEEDRMSEDFLDDIEDVLKEYDTEILQAQVDDLYDRAEELGNELSDEFEKASDEIEEKTEKASEDAAEKAINSLGTSEKLDVILDESGMSQSELITGLLKEMNIDPSAVMGMMGQTAQMSEQDIMTMVMQTVGLDQDSLMKKVLKVTGLSEEDAAQALMERAAENQGTTKMGLVAEQLGTTEQALQDLSDTIEDVQDTIDDTQISSEDRIQIDLDDMEDDEEYDSEMDIDLSSIRDLTDKIDATGLYDTTEIRSLMDRIEALADTEIDDSEVLNVEDYIAAYNNKAIQFTIEDMGSDAAMFILFAYLVIAVLAFVFAVTTSNTITQEAGVIGTLRASGYTKGELIRHYMVLPMAVTILAAIIGNILGYTVFEDVCVSVYYQSYSLATYETLFNADAFWTTTVVPLILMFVINLAVLIYKMGISPLKFLRHDLHRHGRKKAMHLNTKIPFMHRFRLRILFQNIPAYLTLFIGLLLGGAIVVFGFMFGPLLDDYAEMVKASELAKYQYVLTDQIDTDNEQAEKYCVTSLETTNEDYMIDDVMIYGIEDESSYITEDIPAGQVLVSNGLADKFGLETGGQVILRDKYKQKDYTFTVAGEYTYDAALSLFMNRSDYLETFGEDDDYFSGYLSNEELTDIDDEDIASVITETDLTKVSDQLNKSMGEFMSLFKYFGTIMFILLMYLMTKQIIEKNLQSIAMTKILGFKNTEISGLYLVITSIMVVISLLVSVPVIDQILRWCFHSYIYTEMTGYIPYIVDKSCFVKMVVMGIGCYLIVCIFMMAKINKIPKSEALKNVE